MLQLFAEVIQEAVYSLCGETYGHISLHCSKYCKLYSTLWILQKKTFKIGFVGAIMTLANGKSSFCKCLLFSNAFRMIVDKD